MLTQAIEALSQQIINDQKLLQQPLKRASDHNSAYRNWKESGDGQPDYWFRYWQETNHNPLVVVLNCPSLGFAKAVDLPFERPYAAYGTYRYAVNKVATVEEGLKQLHEAESNPNWRPEMVKDWQPVPEWKSKARHNGLYWLPYGGGNSEKPLSDRSNQPYVVWESWGLPENNPALKCKWSGSPAPIWNVYRG